MRFSYLAENNDARSKGDHTGGVTQKAALFRSQAEKE
jgi:hypothetical protein